MYFLEEALPSLFTDCREGSFSETHRLEGVRRAEVKTTPALLKLRLVVSYLNNHPY